MEQIKHNKYYNIYMYIYTPNISFITVKSEKTIHKTWHRQLKKSVIVSALIEYCSAVCALVVRG